jgi:hypothetical protein
MGKYQGWFGLEAFANARGVRNQWSKVPRSQGGTPSWSASYSASATPRLLSGRRSIRRQRSRHHLVTTRRVPPIDSDRICSLTCAFLVGLAGFEPATFAPPDEGLSIRLFPQVCVH